MNAVAVQPHAEDVRPSDQTPMRVLFISYWFPPTNVIGAVRAGKFAKYMLEAGHDVRVIAGPGLAPLTLPLEVPDALVSRSEIPPEAPPHPLLAAAGAHARGHPGALGRLATQASSRLRHHWYAARQIPDKQRQWIGLAEAIGRTVLQSWRPDVIVASAPPYSCLVAAARLSAETGIPWVAELRDPWAGNVYNDRPAWRERVDRVMERRTLRSASALVAVSPVVTRDLRVRYPQSALTVLNGFAPEDLPPQSATAPHEALNIVYTGTIYAGHRDPSPLFAAIARLPEAARRRVRVLFYGPSEDQVHALAARHAVLQQVAVMPTVGYAESLARQAAADVLLLLQRNDPSDEGNVPAKFFEYIGALRPILLLGYEAGVLAGMIRERGAGLVSNDPSAIATQLEAWLAQSATVGIPALPVAARAGLSRAEQFAGYEEFLRARIGGG